MTQISKEARIVLACAISLAAIDIYVRFATAPKAATASVVTAQEFRLTDKDGNVRAVMNTDANGEPGLVMFDKTGTPRLQLDAFETTPSLILMDEHGDKRAYYGMSSPTGDGELSFMGESGNTVASLAISENASQFSLSGNDGTYGAASWRVMGDRVIATVSTR